MSNKLHVYSKEALKKEPFLPLKRPFPRSLDLMEKLKKQVRKYRGKWNLENHLAQRYKKYLGKKLPHELEIQWVNAHIGNGVFAKEPIKKGGFICEYIGLITDEKELHPDNRYVFNLTVGDDETGFVLDARYSGNVARTINHADDPNAEAVTIFVEGLPRVVYLARRNIKKGEEICVDYGQEYWSTWKEQKQ
jgi:SET domain-containing protein